MMGARAWRTPCSFRTLPVLITCRIGAHMLELSPELLTPATGVAAPLAFLDSENPWLSWALASRAQLIKSVDASASARIMLVVRRNPVWVLTSPVAALFIYLPPLYVFFFHESPLRPP